MSELKLAILTPEGRHFDGAITSVTAPGVRGSFAVFRNHAPFISALETGIVKVAEALRESYFLVDGGYFEVHANEAVILASKVEPAEDARHHFQLMSGEAGAVI